MNVASRTHQVIAVISIALALSATAQQSAIPSLSVSLSGNGGIRLGWPTAANGFSLEEAGTLGNASIWTPLVGSPLPENGQFTVTLVPGNAPRFYRLRQTLTPSTFQIAAHTPLDGATEVGVTVRPQVFFSEPVDATTLSADNFFAEAAGVDLGASIVPANDGSFAWLFFKQSMPGDTRVRVSIDGAGIRSRTGESLDPDGDGVPGGVGEFEFTTVSTQGMPGTSLSGIVVDPGPDLIPRSDDDLQAGPDGRLGTTDDNFLLPIQGVKVHLLGLESRVVTTQADGKFHFDTVPVGDVKVVIDGTTATLAPTGIYFPEMVIDAQMVRGKENWSMTNGSEVYLPRISKNILQTVSAGSTNQINATPDGASGLSAFQRSQLSIRLPPNSLIGADGRPLSGGQVGISTVPAEIVRDMLPPGVLQHTFDITVQAPGIAAFSTPASMSFPNMFNAAPGTQLNFLSFDHTTGRLVIEGTATVSADGSSVQTDPGTGITHPGWHGLTPPGGPNDPSDNPDPECQSELLAADEPADDSGVSLQRFNPSSPGGLRPETEGISDYFFNAGDGESFTLRFRNPAPAPAKASKAICGPDSTGPKPLVFKISIQGNDRAVRFLEGLDKSIVRPFLLRPGQEKKLKVTLTPLLKGIRKIEVDRLYGAKLTIQGWESGSPNNLLLNKTIYVGRYLDAMDANHVDGTLTMAPTAVGHDGIPGVVRERNFEVLGVPLRLRLPANAGDAPFVILGHQVDFAPSGRGPTSRIEAEVVSPANEVIGRLNLEGNATLQEYYVDGARIRDVLAKAAAGQIPGVTDAQKAFLKPNGALDRIVSNVLASADSLLQTYASGVARATVEPTLGVKITAYSTDQASSPDQVDGDTLGRSDGIDICSLDAVNCTREVAKPLSELLALVPKMSRAEAAFRLSKSLNTRPNGSFELYIDHFLTAKRRSGPQTGVPYLLSEDALVLHLATTIVHELGHTLGMVHTYNSYVARTTKTCGCSLNAQGKPIPDYRTDIMAHGEVLGASVFTASGAAFQVALGLEFVPGEAMLALKYFEANLRGAKKIGAGSFLMGFEGAPDGNELVFQDELPGGLTVYSGEEDLVLASAYDFGKVLTDGPGGNSTNRTFYLVNNGDQSATILATHLSTSVSNSFTVPTLPSGTIIPAHESLPLVIEFDPTQTGPAVATLELLLDGVPDSVEIDVAGFGLSPGPDLRIELENNNVGGAIVGVSPKQIRHFGTLTNIGSSELVMSGIASGLGGNVSSFSLTGLPPNFGAANPIRLKPGESFTFDISFAPTRLGLQREELHFLSNDADAPIFTLHVVGTGLPTVGSSLDYGHDFVAMESPDFPNSPVLRAQSDAEGHFTVFLPPDQRYHQATFDPVSGLIAHNLGITATSGKNTQLGVPVFLPSLAPDSDDDGLPDDIEFALGTNPNKADTDGDGVDDFIAVLQGVDPLGGKAAVTGVIAQVTIEQAIDVAVLPNPRGDALLAYVIDNARGLVIVDVTRASQPVVLGRLALRGRSAFVAVDPVWQIATVSGDSFVHLIDISDPGSPRLIQSSPFNAPSQTAAVDGYAYFEANYGTLHALNTRSGIIDQHIDLPGNYVKAIVREGAFLYILDPNDLLRIVQIDGAQMRLRGSLPITGGAGRLVVVDGIAYVPLSGRFDSQTGVTVAGGYATFDVSNPDNPILIANSSVPVGIGAPGTAVALSGSGFGLLLGRAPVVGNSADLLNVSDPKNTYSFITRFNLPETPVAAVISSGTAYIADGTAGLIILNYQAFDTAGQLPTPTLSGVFAPSDPTKSITDIIEGSRFRVQAAVTDDAQVSTIELLVNGQSVKSSRAVPFDLEGFAPNITGTTNTFLVQVRATDTGGNVGLSKPILIHLLRDTTAPVLLRSDPTEGDEELRGLASIRLVFSEPLASASLQAANFEVVHESGLVTHPTAFVWRDFNRELELTVAPLDSPGNYRCVIHAANVTDGAGNPLGRTDIARAFRVLPYSIRWDRKEKANWFTATNWFPQRVPTVTDWVNIGAVPTNAAVHLSSHNPAVPTLEKVRVRSLTSKADLVLLYCELQVDEPFICDGSLYLTASKLTDTVLVGGPMSVLGYNRGPTDPFVTREGYFSVLDGVTLRGDLEMKTEYHILNRLTLQGNIYGKVDRKSGFNGLLHATRDTVIQGPGTFHDLPLEVSSGELNAPNRPGPLVTIGSDITFRGALNIGLEGPSSRLINRGKLLADSPLPFASGRYYSAINMVGGVGTNESLINEGTILASNGYRLLISGPYNTRLINRGALRVETNSFLWFSVPLVSPKVRCEAGGVVQLSGRGAPWTTDAGQVSELSGPGLWLASESEFQGGTIRLTEDAILEGTAVFNNVTFEGELHNYDWNSRRAALPDYLVGYGNQVQVLTNLTLNGLIAFHRPDSSSSGGRLYFLGAPSRLDGQGRVEFDGLSRFNQIQGSGVADAPGFLTLGPNITIHGKSLTIGNISGVDSGQLPFVANQGTILTQPGDLLSFGTYSLTNSGVIRIAGTNQVNVRFNFDQTTTGRLEFEASNPASGPANGQLNVAGTVTLDGALKLSLAATYSPSPGDAFALLLYPSVLGQFASISAPTAPSNLEYAPEYGPKKFQLQLR